MKRLLLLLPAVLVACGSQLVEFPEGSGATGPAEPAPTTVPPPVGTPLPADQDASCDCDIYAALPVENCTNGVDDDGDELVDCDDPDCELQAVCRPVVDASLPPVEDASLPPVEDASLPPEQDASAPPPVEDASVPPPPVEDAGPPPVEDAGPPPPVDMCGADVPKTCEEKLHCCMNACKPLVHEGEKETKQHVSCVQNCANAHKVCVKNRRCSK